MSVLKSIFHRYNKTTSSYDTLHPETEHAQVTDFGQGVIAHLASNVLASTISSLTTDSLMAKLVKLVFNATGVQYNIAQNGYVKFGDLFGGLIIQWGYDSSNSDTAVLNYNISIALSFNTLLFRAAGGTGDDTTNINWFSGTTMSVTTFKSLQTDNSHKVKRPFFYLIICK